MPFVPDVHTFAPLVRRTDCVLRFEDHKIGLLYSSNFKISNLHIERVRRSNASNAMVDAKLWRLGSPSPFVNAPEELNRQSTLCVVPLHFLGTEFTERLEERKPSAATLRLLEFFKAGARLHLEVKVDAERSTNLFLRLDYRLPKHEPHHSQLSSGA